MKKLPFISLAITVLALLPGLAQATQWQQIQALDQTVSLSVPSELSPMSAEYRALKFPYADESLAVYANESGSVSLAIKQHELPPGMDLDDLEPLLQVMLDTFKHVSPKGQILTLNGRPAIRLDFIINALDTDIQNRILVIPVAKTKMVMVNFNVVKAQQAQWQALGEQIILSIKVAN